MKRKTNLFLSFIFALVAALGLGFSLTNSPLSASAASVTITYVVDPNVNMDAADKTATTKADGTLASFPTAKRDGYLLLGWKIGEAGTEPVDKSTVFDTDTSLYPIWTAKTYVYTITQKPDTTLHVVGSTATEGKTYDLIVNADSLSTAITHINSDNVSTNPSTLNFSDYTLKADETITLTQSINISGSLTSSNAGPILNIAPTPNSTFSFTNLTLTNNAYGTLISVNETTSSHTLAFKGANLNTTVQGTSAVAIQPTTTVSLDGTMSHTSTYLYDYLEGSGLTLTSKDLSAQPTLKIALGIEFDGTIVSSNIRPIAYDQVDFVAKNETYYVEKTLDDTTFVVNTILNVEYDRDGGSFKNGYTTPLLMYLEDGEPITLPTAANISKQYAAFDGWFAKVVLTEQQKTDLGLSSTTYYFDIEALNNYLSNSATLADLDTYFKTDLESFTQANAISAYQYAATQTNNNAWANFFVSNNIKPRLIARWDYVEYTITFVTNEGSAVDPLVAHFDDTITSPITTREGYSFTGWFIDDKLVSKYTFDKMPAENFTLYAGWTINQYTITFVKNNGEADSTTTQIFGDTIVFPENLALEGHKLTGWFTEDTLTNQFTQTTIPADNISLYAKWEKVIYSIYFDMKPTNTSMSPIKTVFGDVPVAPANPTATGYTFHGWFSDMARTIPFDFTAPTPAKNRTAYAKWTVIQYQLTYNYNNGTTNTVISKDFDSVIAIPTEPSKNGYLFEGWYADEQCTILFNFNTSRMPANDFTLYAKWSPKIVISLTFDEKQSVEIDSRGKFTVPSNISGFTVQYFVNNEWTTNVPNTIGVYNVRIFRAEDEHYAEYIKVLENGFEVVQKTLDISWLPIALIIVFIIEIGMVIVIKLLRKKKLHQTIILQSMAVPMIELPFGLIPQTQFILSIVTAALALFGFIYMIVELVKLHRTIPLADQPDTKYDNRALLEKRGDKSEDASISNNVNELLRKEGLYISDNYSKDDQYKVDEDIIERADNSYTGKIKNNDDNN